MRCADCGSENREGARFCARCGANMAEQESPVPAEPVVEVPAQQAPDSSAEDAQVVEDTAAAADEGSADDGTGAGAFTLSEEALVEEVGASDLGGSEGQGQDGQVEVEATPPAELAQSIVVEADALPSDEGAEGLAIQPLPAGARLQGRYEIVDVLESGPDGYLYSALDLGRCAKCGHGGNDPDSGYCAECGAALETPVRCTIRQAQAMAEPSIADQFSESGFTYTVVLEPEADEETRAPAGGARLVWGQRTDVGRTRQVNEDYVDARVYSPHHGPSLGLFVVADGVGGQEHGEVASSLAAEVLWDRMRAGAWEPEMRGEPALPEVLEQTLRDAVQAANQAVYQIRVKQASNMGTTVTAALLRENLAIIANVGDSRTYLWGPDGLQRLTVDHSVVESLVAAGRVTREQVYSHPQRNLIYRSLGDRPTVEVDTFVRELELGESLLLCSDGLWEMAHDDGIVDVLMREGNPQQACDALVDLANLAGGEDNISAIIVRVDRRE